MSFLNKLKLKITDLTGYWIYKKEHLPIGIDLFFDFSNRYNSNNIEVIFDVGGNVGQSVRKFKDHIPNCTIYSFEPVKATFQDLQENCEGYNNVFAKNIGLGSKKEQRPIYIESQSVWNSLIPKEENFDYHKQEIIKIDSIDNFMNDNKINKIDVLKTDTEGFDLEVLKGAKRC